MLTTQRLILRQWRDSDIGVFADISADREVMEFYPKPLSFEESVQMASRIRSLIEQRGWGFWAVELAGEESFIGFVGLHTPKPELPFSPCVEVGWRIAKAHWGKGYATEAANAALHYAFTTLARDEVVAFTTCKNMRSRRVMEKVGMHNSGQNFMHPDVPLSHEQCEHVLYRVTREQWQAMAGR